MRSTLLSRSRRPLSSYLSLSLTHPPLPFAGKFSFRWSTRPSISDRSNQILSPMTTPPVFHDYLRLASANNSLLLLLFTTSACPSTPHISPIIEKIVMARQPSPGDRFECALFAHAELDSPDESNGAMRDLGVEYGITSIPSLVGFGGRRAERVTERLEDERVLGDEGRLGKWLEKEMEKGDPFALGN